MMGKPVGSVSTFIRHLQRQQRERGEVNVPCGTCTACCRSPRLSASLLPAEESRFPDAVPVPDRPTLKCLPRKPDGTCSYLIDNRCAIYATRPLSCRTYDCRANLVVGVFDASDPIMQEALGQWEDVKMPLAVDRDMRIAFQLAIAELRANLDRSGGVLSAGQALNYALTHYRRFMETPRRARETLMRHEHEHIRQPV